MAKKPKDPRRLGRELARAFSAQSRQSNRLWLTLFVFSAVTLFADRQQDIVTLPFSLGKVPIATYDIVAFVMLTVLTLAFCQASTLTHAAVRFAQDSIDKIESAEDQLEARRFFDISVVSAFSRVSQLSRIPWSDSLSTIAYCILKLIAVLILLGIPAGALYISLTTLSNSWPTLWYLFFALLLVAYFGLAKIAWLELRHSYNVARMTIRGGLDRFFGLAN